MPSTGVPVALLSSLIWPTGPNQRIDPTGLAPTSYVINLGSGRISSGILYDRGNPAKTATVPTSDVTTTAPDGISYQVSAVNRLLEDKKRATVARIRPPSRGRRMGERRRTSGSSAR